MTTIRPVIIQDASGAQPLARTHAMFCAPWGHIAPPLSRQRALSGALGLCDVWHDRGARPRQPCSHMLIPRVRSPSAALQASSGKVAHIDVRVVLHDDEARAHALVHRRGVELWYELA